MFRKKLLTLALLGLFASSALAQINLEYWPYEKKNVQERKTIDHRYTSESAVKYHKRIHRIIDLREKQNKPMVWPKSNLIEILHTAAMRGPNREDGLTVYKSENLEKGEKYLLTEIAGLGADSTPVQVVQETEDGEEYYVDTMVVTRLDIREIHKLKIMEDWVYDHKYSDFRPRIVAVAPIFNLSSSGIDLGEQPLFWVKMEDARDILVNSEVFNPHNDLRTLTFDDWFEQRMFSSYIIKESNVFDTEIKYQEGFEDDGMAQLLEADRIKNDLYIFEHDQWEY